jgi:hypothetical protein
MRKLAPLLLVFALCACGSTGVRAVHSRWHTVPGHSDGTVVFYTSGQNKVNCYVTVRDSRVGTRAYCIQRHHAAPVTGVAMNGSGSLTICHGKECGKLPDLAPELYVGEQVGAPNSPFDCTVLSAGVRCTIVKTGTGFLIGAEGVQRVLHLGAFTRLD